MVIRKRMNRCFRLVFFITIIIYFSGSLRAQIQSIDSLRSVIKTKEDSLGQLNNIYKRINNSFDALNAVIFNQKKDLERSSNPLTRILLSSNLKESTRLAAKLDKLQEQIRRIRQDLQNDYQQIIAATDSLIKKTINAFQNQQNSHSQIAILNSISKLDDEKKTWQKRLTELTPNISEKSLLEIEPDDNIERLQLKIKLIQDRIWQLDENIKKLNQRYSEFQSDLQIYEEMLNFMDNLQQNIDPEQEYFDQEHSDQFKEEVRNTRIKISEINQRTKQLIEEKAKLSEKLRQFEDYFQKKFKE